MEGLFHRTTWSNVKSGDTVLLPWLSLDRIVEIEVADCYPGEGLDGTKLIFVHFVFCSAFYSKAFDPDETVYVQSRL